MCRVPVRLWLGQHAPIAHLVEQLAFNQLVEGSSPSRRTNILTTCRSTVGHMSDKHTTVVQLYPGGHCLISVQLASTLSFQVGSIGSNPIWGSNKQ